MSAIEDIRQRAAIKAKERADLEELAAIKQSMKKQAEMESVQQAYDLGTNDGSYAAAQALQQKLDNIFGGGGPKARMVETYGPSDIPKGLADAVIGGASLYNKAADAVNNGAEAVSSFFMDAMEPTSEERARDAALGEQMRRSMQEAGQWSPSNK